MPKPEKPAQDEKSEKKEELTAEELEAVSGGILTNANTLAGVQQTQTVGVVTVDPNLIPKGGNVM